MNSRQVLLGVLSISVSDFVFKCRTTSVLSNTSEHSYKNPQCMGDGIKPHCKLDPPSYILLFVSIHRHAFFDESFVEGI